MTEQLASIAGVRPLWSDGTSVIAYRNGRIAAMEPTLRGMQWQIDLKLPLSSRLARLAAPIRLARRMLRVEPTDAVRGPCGGIYVNQRSTIWRVDIETKQLTSDFTIPEGRNALALCNLRGIDGFADSVCFGDYFDNPDKGPVRLWQRQAHRAHWEVAHIFPAGEIDHVHSIVPDPYRQCVWILTGDFGGGAALWQARNNFRDVVPIARGQQLHRATWLYVTSDALYYATDTQLEQNYLCRLSQSRTDGTWKVDRLCPIPGSSIYGTPAGDGFLFSTAVEPGMPSGRLIPDLLERMPGPGINGSSAHIFRLDPAGQCIPVLSAQKDIWPMRLMQFGTFHLTAVPGIGAYAYGVGLAGYDGRAIMIPG